MYNKHERTWVDQKSNPIACEKKTKLTAAVHTVDQKSTTKNETYSVKLIKK